MEWFSIKQCKRRINHEKKKIEENKQSLPIVFFVSAWSENVEQ